MLMLKVNVSVLSLNSIVTSRPYKIKTHFMSSHGLIIYNNNYIFILSIF